MPNGRRGRKQASSSRSRGKPRPIKTILREMDILNPAPQPRRWKKPSRPTQREESHPLYPMKVPKEIRRMVSQEEWSKEVQRRIREVQEREQKARGERPLARWEQLIEDARNTTPEKRNMKVKKSIIDIRDNKKVIYGLLEKIKKFPRRNILTNKEYLGLVRKLMIRGLYQAQLQQHQLALGLPDLELSSAPISHAQKQRLLQQLKREVMQEALIKDILSDEKHFIRVAGKIRENYK